MRRAVRAIIIRDDDLLVMRRNKFGQEYYTLVGGGIQVGETPEQALHREVAEESSLRVLSERLVYIEEAGDPFGIQYIYLCEYAGHGQPRLAADSEEMSINQLGQNIHEPLWMPLAMLPKITLRSEALKHALLDALKHGFPKQPEHINPDKYHHAIHKQRS
ncbi:MAG TPA: NUDIX domain-containing protein [Candidatus Saccharimonadales bacterium]|nr:NUDIX domain-containing protein [Candidatus Saccharimonadales bacterium]